MADEYRALAESALTALESSGYIVRPREATEGMLAAAEAYDGHTVYDSNASAETHDTAMTEAWDRESTINRPQDGVITHKRSNRDD